MLKAVASLHDVRINPQKLNEVVEHYSIPAWVSLNPELVQSNDIESNKILLPDEEHILVSCLNPSTHKVWRVAKNNSNIKRVASTEWAVVIPHNFEDIDYINSALESYPFQFQMNGYVTGTTNSHQRVKKADFLALIIPFPDEQTRNKIGELHKLIREKTASNQKISEYISDYISVLFRSCFIVFDPIKAKTEGQLPYGMDEETAALFPDSFEDSELGPIPTGWKIGMMEDVLSRKQDTTTPGEHLSERYYVPIDNIDSKCLTLKNWLPYDDAASSLILFSKNDLLFGAMRPYFHKVTIAPFDGITRSTCFVFKPKVPEIRGFSLCLLNLDSTIRYSTDSSLGSTMPYAIWKNGLARHKIVLPPSQIMVAFSETISPFIDKIRDVGLSARSLSSVRDVILPRLMSGELKVN